MTNIEKAERAAKGLRARADRRADELSRPPSGIPGLRDFQADALADLADVVLSLARSGPLDFNDVFPDLSLDIQGPDNPSTSIWAVSWGKSDVEELPVIWAKRDGQARFTPVEEPPPPSVNGFPLKFNPILDELQFVAVNPAAPLRYDPQRYRKD